MMDAEKLKEKLVADHAKNKDIIDALGRDGHETARSSSEPSPEKCPTCPSRVRSARECLIPYMREYDDKDHYHDTDACIICEDPWHRPASEPQPETITEMMSRVGRATDEALGEAGSEPSVLPLCDPCIGGEHENHEESWSDKMDGTTWCACHYCRLSSEPSPTLADGLLDEAMKLSFIVTGPAINDRGESLDDMVVVSLDAMKSFEEWYDRANSYVEGRSAPEPLPQSPHCPSCGPVSPGIYSSPGVMGCFICSNMWRHPGDCICVHCRSASEPAPCEDCGLPSVDSQHCQEHHDTYVLGLCPKKCGVPLGCCDAHSARDDDVCAHRSYCDIPKAASEPCDDCYCDIIPDGYPQPTEIHACGAHSYGRFCIGDCCIREDGSLNGHPPGHMIFWEHAFHTKEDNCSICDPDQSAPEPGPCPTCGTKRPEDKDECPDVFHGSASEPEDDSHPFVEKPGMGKYCFECANRRDSPIHQSASGPPHPTEIPPCACPGRPHQENCDQGGNGSASGPETKYTPLNDPRCPTCEYPSLFCVCSKAVPGPQPAQVRLARKGEPAMTQE